MEKLNTIKGTKDLFEKDLLYHDEIIANAGKISRCLNYERIVTPIIESTNVFVRTLGKTSDIISKEMYTFIDQGKDEITLRPEGTAAVARALISNSLYENTCQKYYYFGPMFRREKPQSGRLRQFNQFGLEYFNQDNFLSDTEVIFIANKLIESLNINDQVVLQINTLGNRVSRETYKENLKKYFLKYKQDLSHDSKVRLEMNVLRILDSKDSKDKEIALGAPIIMDYLDLESKTFYENLKNSLEELKIKFYENNNLVRGLDYYNHTAFEFVTKSEKRQNTIIAGGRYNGLVKSLGGKDICGVGWAAGIERISSLLEDKLFRQKKKIISIISTSDELNLFGFKILDKLIEMTNISFNLHLSGTFKKKISKANKINSVGSIIIGDDEIKSGDLIWKDFQTGKQELVKIKEIQTFITTRFL